MGKTILFGILVAAIVLVSFFGDSDSVAQASTKKPRPTLTATKPKPTATKPKPTATKPKPTAVPTAVPEPDFHWEMENNPALLTETGDYTMAWWSWFKQRPGSGSAFVLMNHFKEKDNPFATASGAAFSANGQIPEIVTTNLGKRKVVLHVYRNAYLIAPRWSKGIVAAQVSGPKVGKWGLPAGVNIFLSESEYQSWLARNR